MNKEEGRRKSRHKEGPKVKRSGSDKELREEKEGRGE